MLLGSLEQLHNFTGVLVDVVILLGAIGAAIKFRIFNLFGPRLRTELVCSHYELPDSSILFTAEYTFFNAGERTLHLSDVTIKLVAAKRNGVLLVPDESRLYAEREILSSDSESEGLFRIEAGERTIYALEAVLPKLDDAVFILCSFSFRHRREPKAYTGFYVRRAPTNRMIA